MCVNETNRPPIPGSEVTPMSIIPRDANTPEIPVLTRPIDASAQSRTVEVIRSDKLGHPDDVLVKSVGQSPLHLPREGQRKASVMSPIPAPRCVLDDASVALSRGLGRMFGNYGQIPDLGRTGARAIAEAERCFWNVLRGQLEEADLRWDKRDRSDGRTLLILHGIDSTRAVEIWKRVTKAMNASSGGPGLRVASPEFISPDHLAQGGPVAETYVLFWPDKSLADKLGNHHPPVRFREDTSPGYQELLLRHGLNPYFADGWLCIPRGDHVEQWRIGGLPDLLFPEGRDAIRRIYGREQQGYEAKLNMLMREPGDFRHEDEQVEQGLRQAIRRAQQFISRLSLYDCQDLVLCIFEAFHRQRDFWAREEIKLPSGEVVSTKPYGRFLRMDAEDLRLRLDPSQSGGRNWRSRMMDRFYALTTFERTVRGRRKRRLDIGDRFLERVLDPYEPAHHDSDDWKFLKTSGAFSDNAFYVKPSFSCMKKLVYFAVGEAGFVTWGLQAAKWEADKSARAKAISLVRSSPYYEHSPRLLSVSNLEAWTPQRKSLVHVVLSEQTPHFRRDKARRRHRKSNHLGGHQMLRRFADRDYIACNGSQGYGYRVATWITRVGYEKRAGAGGRSGVLRQYLNDLAALTIPVDQGGLGLVLEAKGKSWNTAAVLAFLDSSASRPSACYDTVLKKYLPVDLEDRLRDRLAEVGINALDDGEDADPHALTPEDISMALGQAKEAGVQRPRAEVAKALGVSPQTISAWKRGIKPVPQARMERLKEVLGAYLERAQAAKK